MGETPSGRIYVEREEQQKDEIERRIKAKYPNADVSKFRSKINEYDKVVLKLPRSNAKEYHLDDDVKKLPLQLRGYLGKSIYTIKAEEIAINTALNEKTKVAVKELEEQKERAPPEEQSEYDRKINILQEQANDRSRQNERLRAELPLRIRIKEIFKKYGFTVIAVSTAIATVIGVIVSNLKAGLTKVAKGVGNGLKELGKKLGEILPGMIGAIASFIFQTAGEVIGFLAKNAWLLIVGLVVFAVEQFKNKKK